MEEIEFSWWLFEGRLRQGKNVLPDGLNWLCYFAGSSKSHRENSISFIFLESPHQVDMKNVVKSSKHFFGYFNTLETHSDYLFAGFALGSIEGRVAISYANVQNPKDNFTFKCHRSNGVTNGFQDIYAVNDIAFHPVHGKKTHFEILSGAK